MKKNQNQKIKHLKAVRLWPSIVFLILTLFLALMLFCSFILGIPVMLANERIESAYETSQAIAFNFEDENGTEQIILDRLIDHGELKDPILIFDADGPLITGSKASYTDMESFLRENSPYGFGKGVQLYIGIDNLDNLIDPLVGVNGDLLVTKIGEYGILSSKKSIPKVVATADFWAESILSDGRIVLVKCSVPVYSNDFSQAAKVSISTLMGFLLPIFFLLVSVIICITNQNRMKKVLYYSQVTGGKNYTYFEHTAQEIINARRSSGRQL